MTAKKTNTKSVANRRTNLKKTKKNLKQLSRSGDKHALRSSIRIVKYGAKSFTRNLWLSAAATLVMTFTLVILCITVAASVILTNTANLMREKIDITIYLKPGISEKVLSQLTAIVSDDPNTKTVNASTSRDEYQKFLTERAEDSEILTALDDEEMSQVMLSKMKATLRIKVKDATDFTSLRKIVEENELFQEYLDPEKSPTYDVNQAEISTITTWANIARKGGSALGIIFLIISTLIIFSTIRMSIFSRREEIYMMKLVGADKGFIRGPFLVEAQISGIIAGIIAATISFFGFKFLTPKLADFGIDVSFITNILDSNQVVFVFLSLILIGAGIGSVSALLATKRYLKKTK